MKYKSPKILSILIILLFLGCSADGYRGNVMDPDLIEFFGGLNLGMRSLKIYKIEPRLKSYRDSFGISYYGQSINNPILELNLYSDCGSFINPFLNKCEISRIKADFSQNYLISNNTKSFQHWLSYFEHILQRSPIHFYDPTQQYYKDIYLWHFEHYNFEIWRDESQSINTDKAVYFEAYLGGEQYPMYEDITEIFVISEYGDTTRYSFLSPEIKAIFGGFDIGMSIGNVQKITGEYRVDTENDIYFVNLKNGDKIELYFFDEFVPNDPYFIDGNVYKIMNAPFYNLKLNDSKMKENLINRMAMKLNFGPKIFRYVNEDLKMDIYLWHFPSYNFDIRFQYSDDNKIQEVLFYAYKDSDSIPNEKADINIPNLNKIGF